MTARLELDPAVGWVIYTPRYLGARELVGVVKYLRSVQEDRIVSWHGEKREALLASIPLLTTERITQRIVKVYPFDNDINIL